MAASTFCCAASRMSWISTGDFAMRIRRSVFSAGRTSASTPRERSTASRRESSTPMRALLRPSSARAFFKAQEATQVSLPLEGTVLFTIADRDKSAALEPVRLFREMGFRIMTTQGTYDFLKAHGIDTVPVRKLGFGRPNLVDAIKSGEVQLLVNTPSGKRSAEDNSDVRKAAIRYKVPYITTTAAAIAAAKGIAARREGAPLVKSLQDYHKGIV